MAIKVMAKTIDEKCVKLLSLQLRTIVFIASEIVSMPAAHCTRPALNPDNCLPAISSATGNTFRIVTDAVTARFTTVQRAAARAQGSVPENTASVAPPSPVPNDAAASATSSRCPCAVLQHAGQHHSCSTLSRARQCQRHRRPLGTDAAPHFRAELHHLSRTLEPMIAAVGC
jgi:hypothetical protein